MKCKEGGKESSHAPVAARSFYEGMGIRGEPGRIGNTTGTAVFPLTPKGAINRTGELGSRSGFLLRLPGSFAFRFTFRKSADEIGCQRWSGLRSGVSQSAFGIQRNKSLLVGHQPPNLKNKRPK
jgi:hypothetical protein